MIRTGHHNQAPLYDGSEVYMDGQPVEHLTSHPEFKPRTNIRTRIDDLQYDMATRDVMTLKESGVRFPMGNQIPLRRRHWLQNLKEFIVLRDIGGVLTRVGDETVGEMWSLADGKEILHEIAPRFTENINESYSSCGRNMIHVMCQQLRIHFDRETNAGTILRGANYETAAVYRKFGWDGPLDLIKHASGLSENTHGKQNLD